MIENNVRDIIVKHRDQIIDMAASKLAESLRRSKAVKEAVGMFWMKICELKRKFN